MMWWSRQKYFWTLNLTKSWFLFINQLCKAWKVWKYEHQVQKWTKERRWWGGASQNDFISFSSSSFISVGEFLLQNCAIKVHWGNNFVIGQLALKKLRQNPIEYLQLQILHNYWLEIIKIKVNSYAITEIIYSSYLCVELTN